MLKLGNLKYPWAKFFSFFEACYCFKLFYVTECSTSELLFCIPGINVNGLTDDGVHDFSQGSLHLADDSLSDLMKSVNISSISSSRIDGDDSEGTKESYNESEIDKEVDKEFEAKFSGFLLRSFHNDCIDFGGTQV